MWQSIIAVLGTLAGAVVAGALQQRSARASQIAARDAELRRDRLAAVQALAVAVADHRRAMWVREEARFAGASQARVEELRDASHITRSAITAPHTAIRVLVADGATREAASRAIQATYDMRNAMDLAELRSARLRSVGTEAEFVSIAAAYLNGTR